MVSGYQAWPNLEGWAISLLMILAYGLIARWVGLRSGLIRGEIKQLAFSTQALLGLRLLIHPALVEESVFRGLLLPTPSPPSLSPSAGFWYGLSLLLFVTAHPLNGLILRRERRQLFTHPAFLFLAALLGLWASALYWITASLWPPVLLHWLVVFIWLTRYGGTAHLEGRV